MSLAYRAVPDDDEYRPVYRQFLRYAFAPEQGPDWDDEIREQPAEFEPRGLYERAERDERSERDGTAGHAGGRPPSATGVEPASLVVAGGLLDFEFRIRGAFRPVGGVTAIASPPERRRRGSVSTLLDEMHDELRGRDVALAALWPFSHPFYRRFGYGRTNDYVVHEFPPEALDTPAATPTEDGSLRRLAADDPADLDALSHLHEAAASEPLALRRSADWWRLRVFRSWTDERFVYGWEDDSDDLRAYLAYRFEEGDGDEGRTLVVDDWGAADDEAYRQFLAFLRNHDSQASAVRLVAGDVNLLDRLSDPADDVTTKIRPGPMVRVVDVERALSNLVTPATDEQVVLRVRDDRHDWNDGRFAFGVDDGRTTCHRVSSETPSDGAVTADIGALSRLVVGARSARALSDLEQVDSDDDAVARLDALLPVERPGPYLREFF